MEVAWHFEGWHLADILPTGGAVGHLVYRPCGMRVLAKDRAEAIERFKAAYYDGPNAIAIREHWRDVTLNGERVL